MMIREADRCRAPDGNEIDIRATKDGVPVCFANRLIPSFIRLSARSDAGRRSVPARAPPLCRHSATIDVLFTSPQSIQGREQLPVACQRSRNAGGAFEGKECPARRFGLARRKAKRRTGHFREQPRGTKAASSVSAGRQESAIAVRGRKPETRSEGPDWTTPGARGVPRARLSVSVEL
jgi:hypothetical protein